MTNCGNIPPTSIAPRAVCPVNGREYRAVARTTLLHHLRGVWRRKLPEQAYYFCDDPDCAVVYFGADGLWFTLQDLREPVGQKSRDPQRPLCYCFGINHAEAVDDSRCREFVVAQTKSGSCDCRIRNPSGRCCLGDFPPPPDTSVC
jgi:hypothetical protein